MPSFTPQELERFAIAVLEGAGASRSEAQIVAAHLVEASLAGHDSHGVLRIPQYVRQVQAGQIKTGVHPKIELETPSSAVLDGQSGFGQVVAREAMSLAIRKASTNVIAAVTARQCSHTGRLGSYSAMAAAQNMIGMVMVNGGGAGRWVAPFGGIAGRLGTNPLSIAAPSGRAYPLLLDISTSVVPEGKIRNFYQQGKVVPEGWLIDYRGQPTTDPKQLYDPPGGALLPLGGSAGHKGFGLAFMIDILAGVLSGAGCCGFNPRKAGDGVLLIAIDVQRFCPLKAFCAQVDELIDYLKSSAAAPGFKEVLVPGEMEFRQQQKRRREGVVVPEPIWSEIQTVAKGLGVSCEFAERGTYEGSPVVSDHDAPTPGGFS